MADWIRVDSSLIDSVLYDQTAQKLSVRFLDGRVYEYQGVPQDVAQGLISAQSPGNYFWTYIRGAYDTAETE